MPKQQRKKKHFTKVVDEQYPLSKRRGGGLIKIEVWEDQKGNMVKYSMAYINHLIFAGDNGRVLGYDNSHNYHYKHYFGEIYPVDDFITYENLLARFEQEIKEFIT